MKKNQEKFTSTLNRTFLDEAVIRNVAAKKEMASIFPEAIQDHVRPKLREIETQISVLEKEATIMLRRSRSIKDGWFVREIVKAFEIADIVALKKEGFRLRRYLPQPAPQKGRISDTQIVHAKEYPIVDLAASSMGEVKKCGRAWRTLCPYHNERTPSFYLYPETGTFHCFGCQEHGDVIALTQHLMSLGFIEAVKHLTPYEN